MKFFSLITAALTSASIVQGAAVSSEHWSINPQPLVKRQQLPTRYPYSRIVYTDPVMKAQLLAAHNAYRAHHGAPALTWNNKLAQKAYLTSTNCIFQHSTVQDYGENVFASSAGLNNPAFWVYLWYNEITSYNYNQPGFSAATGHFTQLIWNDSTELGCSWVQGCNNPNQAGLKQMVWCEYNPPGNVLPNSNFANHVLPPLASPPAPAVPAQTTSRP